MSLHDELHVGEAPADELITAVGSSFRLSRWETGRVVEYLGASGNVALRVIYERHGFGIADIERGPDLTDDQLSELRLKIEADVLADQGTVVLRDFLFSAIPIEGWWRFDDEWQILPPPDDAPKASVLSAPHPLLIELRVHDSPNGAIRNVRRERRIWELHVVLSMLLQGGVGRISPRSRHFWAYARDNENGATAYVQEMYFVPGFKFLVAQLTDPGGHDRIAQIPDDEYFTRSGISPEHQPLQVPQCLHDVSARLETASEEIRDRFLLSAYWRDRALAVWETSTSLTHICLVNALEVLLPESELDRCPTCGLDRSPGPTRKLKNLLDTYAPDLDLGDRRELYKLRSALVHGRAILGLDLPRGFGALVPGDWSQRDILEAAHRASRVVAINWLRGMT